MGVAFDDGIDVYNSSVTSHTASKPTSATDGTPSSPTLWIVALTHTGNEAFSAPSGWTTLASRYNANGAVILAAKLYTSALDSSVTFTTANAQTSNGISHTFTGVGGWDYTTAGGTSGVVNPPSHTSAWTITAADDMWVCYGGGREAGGNAGYSTPSGYTTVNVRYGTYYMTSESHKAGTDSATEDPGQISSSTYGYECWEAATLALKNVLPSAAYWGVLIS